MIIKLSYEALISKLLNVIMKVFINGETKEIEKTLNHKQLLKRLSLPDERIAIELNKEVVRKKDWENIKINDADKIEIVHFVGGG